jgi:hypothetical protein
VGSSGGCFGTGDDGGGGGGGRIAIYYSNAMFLPTVNITANGGPGANAGSPSREYSNQSDPPGSPSSLISIQDVWTNIDSFSITWNNSTEPYGIVAAWYKIGSPPTSNTDGIRVSGNDIQRLDNLVVPAEGEIVVYAWLEDVLGNKDYDNRAQATLKFDGSPPVAGSISINNGAVRTISLSLTLNNLGATDLLSGVSRMSFSNNPGGPWSSPEPFSSTKTNWDLSQYGGNSNAGLKTVYVQYGDAAGNWSNSFSDSIYYQPLQSFPFIDDFGTDKGWYGYEPGGWERGLAKAGGGENGNPDPGEEYTGSTDNYILGFAIGADYPNDLIEEKSIISPPIECSDQDRVFLKFRRWLNVESAPPQPNVEGAHARIYVSNDGINWGEPIWENPPIDLMDNQWVPAVFDISSVAAGQATVYVKLTMGPINSSRRFSGWNIDDFEVTSEVIYPSEGTMGTKLEIRGSNFGTKKGKVLIESTPPAILDWAEGLIHCQLTKALAPGVYDVTIQQSGPKGTPPIIEKDAFGVKVPEIYSVDQTEGSANDQVTVSGKFFGTKKGIVYLEYEQSGSLTRKSCKVSTWMMDSTTGDSEIVFVVPKMPPEVCNVVVDPFRIIPEAEEADAYTVKAPEIASVAPNPGSIGEHITISGNYFGSEKGKVYLSYVVNGKSTRKSCSIISWGDDAIVFAVPALPLGSYDVIVTNSVGSDTLPGGFIIK